MTDSTTLTEGFEVWWKKHPKVIYNYPDGKKAWLAACAWQRERDAKVAEAHTCETMAHLEALKKCCRQAIAAAIRATFTSP